MKPNQKLVLILISIISIIYFFGSTHFNLWNIKKEIKVKQKDLNQKNVDKALILPRTEPNVEVTSNNRNQEEDKILDFYNAIRQSELKVYSQNREDGVIQALLNFLNITKPGFYVEFGTESGRECNTRYLREKFN